VDLEFVRVRSQIASRFRHPSSFRRHSSVVGEIQMSHEHDNPVCYHQTCPVCGRNLRIRVMLLGQRVYCQHCGGGFIASDACDNTTATPVTGGRPQASIVDELIERAAVMLGVTPE
jgi:hypothetical protein